MCGGSFAFWFCVVLLFTSSSNTPRNFTSDNEEDNISKETYNHTNFIRNKTNNNNKNHIVPYEKCGNIICIPLCCPLGDRLVKNCTASKIQYFFPKIYNYMKNRKHNKNKAVFPLVLENKCQKTIKLDLYSDNYLKYFNYIIANSSLYLPYFDIYVESTSYCLAVVDHNQFDTFICLEAVYETIYKEVDMVNDLLIETLYDVTYLLVSCRIVSTLCLLTIFVVYSILPELRNMHSFMLRKYCSLLFFGYIIIISQELYPIDIADFSYFCVIIALVNYFCFMSSFFWLSAMSFDMWWTFRDFRLLQRNMRAKQERKKLIYSIFAWGGPFIFIIICIIMDFVPNVPKNLIRPEFCVDSLWFYENAAYGLYFYGPKSVCVISSICLSIYTALKIVRYEKDTARHLTDSESRFYNDNKRWLNLYLRLLIMLFIIMAINWIMGAALIFWFLNDYDVDLLIKLLYVLRITFVMDTMQDIGMFIIFVCKKTIMRQLLKRFCQNCKCFSKTST